MTLYQLSYAPIFAIAKIMIAQFLGGCKHFFEKAKSFSDFGKKVEFSLQIWYDYDSKALSPAADPQR